LADGKSLASPRIDKIKKTETHISKSAQVFMAHENWQKVREVFDAALRQDPEDRQNYLNEACGDDKKLLTELESLLSSLAKSDEFLETPAVAHVAAIIESTTRPLAPGTRFGHYDLIQQIGSGGMGEVYLAKDQKLDRRVAIKILNEKFGRDESNLKRFVREAKAASALNHPNILVIHEIGDSEAAHYIVSEFIEGRTLREVLTQSEMNLGEVLDVSIQIAGALSAAHRAHLVHRDIKPENVMVRPDGYVKVLDFGLAKLVEQENKSFLGLEESTLAKAQTAKGLILGTVNYMSPEQAKCEQVDERTDIFSFGVVIYEMIAGRTPFAGDSMPETFANLINAEPQPLSRFASNVPDELKRIVAKTLRKSKEERYQVMKDVLTDLKYLKENVRLEEKSERSHSTEDATAVSQAATDGVNKPTAETAHGFSQKIKQHKLAASALVALLLAAVGLGYFFFYSRKMASSAGGGYQPIDSVVVLPFANEGGDPNTDYVADGISENLINRLSQLRDLRVVPRNTAFRYKGQEVDPQALGHALGVRGMIVGRVVQRGDVLIIQAELIDVQNQSQLWGEQYHRKNTDLLAIQSEIATGIAEKLRLRLNESERIRLRKRDTENLEAYQFYLRGRYFWGKRNEFGIRKGLENFQQAIDLDPSYARAYAGLADCYNFLGAFGIALMVPGETMPRARAAASRALEIDDSLAEAHTSLAFVQLYYDWDWPAAEKEFQRAIDLDPNYAPAYQWYSHLLMTSGKSNESIAQAKRAVQLDPLSLAANMNLGWQYHWSRQYDFALSHLKAVLEMDPNFEQGRWGVGLAQEGKGAFTEAIEEFKKAASLSGNRPNYLAALGHAYALAGKRADAIRIRNDLESRSKLTYVPPYWMATLYVGLGDKDQAFSWLEKAYQERSGGLVWLRVDPRLDALRQDPRFTALAQRVGFPN